jgi:hypothetical protein
MPLKLTVPPLNLFDAELLRSPRTSQAPTQAPPTTSPAAPVSGMAL